MLIKTGSANGMRSKDVPGTVAASINQVPHWAQEGPRLTNREMAVLGEVARGLSNKQIAMRLSLSELTVRNHLSHIFGKLGASNRTQAVVTAMRSGLRIWP